MWEAEKNTSKEQTNVFVTEHSLVELKELFSLVIGRVWSVVYLLLVEHIFGLHVIYFPPFVLNKISSVSNNYSWALSYWLDDPAVWAWTYNLLLVLLMEAFDKILCALTCGRICVDLLGIKSKTSRGYRGCFKGPTPQKTKQKLRSDPNHGSLAPRLTHFHDMFVSLDVRKSFKEKTGGETSFYVSDPRSEATSAQLDPDPNGGTLIHGSLDADP